MYLILLLIYLELTGFHCSVVGACVYFLLNPPMTGDRPKYGLVIYVCCIWAAATINLSAGIKWNEMIWIDNRNFPGGPPAFIFSEFANPMASLGYTGYIINNCLTDFMVVCWISLIFHVLVLILSFQLHRAWVIWSYNYYVVAIPFLAILTSFSKLKSVILQEGSC